MELDRGILEGLADPLLHMLRNSVDHGIEPAAVRKLSGKPLAGSIQLSAIREKDQFVVLLEDDGRGMDPAHLISLAVERGIVTPEDGWSMSAEQAFLLTCHPGFSTAQQVTDVSGRGVGMDAVRSAIQALGGQLLIESVLGKGTRMILRLPLTIAIINVLLAECAGIPVAIPVNKVIRTVELERNALSEEDGRQYFLLDEEKVPLFDLREVVCSNSRAPYPAIVPILVTTIGERKVGLAVDRFLGHQEVFVKPLGRPLSRLLGLSGGAMLGDGTMVFILDVAGIAQRSGF
jgi:two-component system chemotaxis sensor kinase CheA